jgi:hypothetical protein
MNSPGPASTPTLLNDVGAQDDFYRKLVGSVPDKGYDPIIDTGTRMALRLYGDSIETIDPELRPAWAAVSAMLT